MDTANQRPGIGRTLTGSSDSNRGVIALSILFVASLVAVFFAGGPHQGGMGIFLIIAGLLLLFVPLRHSVSWLLFGLAFLFLFAVVLAVLPEKLLGFPEEWRILLKGVSEAVPEFSVPNCISGDPRATLFWIFVLSASILTGLYCLGCPMTPGQLQTLAIIACLGCSLYAALASVSWTTGWNYPFFTKESWIQPSFGFFPNRNHTAGFLLTGVILSLGLMRYAITGGRILVALIGACTLVLLAGSLLFFSISRGGLFFLLVGAVVWLLGLGKHRSGALLAFSGILFATMLVLFLQSGNGLIDRLASGTSTAYIHPTPNLSNSSAIQGRPSFEPRLSIQRDTVMMIAHHPITGSGLGTYALVYPFYADKSLREYTALHAESDWLTLCAECGIPALLLAFVIIGILCAGIPKLASLSGREWPLRWAFISAFFAELLHGLVDVPLHRPELGWWIMMLGCIGFSGGTGVGGDHRLALRLQRGIFLAGGLAIVLLGGLLIRAEWGGGSSLPPFAPEITSRKLVKLSFQGDPESLRQAIMECRLAISKYPLNHPFYYQLALLHLQVNQDIETAKSLFEIERGLSPNDPSFVFEQGKLFAAADPAAAFSIWKEALRRQLVLDSNPSCVIPRSADLFQSMLSAAEGHPDLLSRLPELMAESSPDLRMIWYNRPECEPSTIAGALRDHSFMEKLDVRQQGRLIELWAQHHVDRAEIEAFLVSHPEYASAALATRASLFASSGHEKEACNLLVESFHLQLPVFDSTGIHSADQDVPDNPLAAARYYIERGNTVAARRILTELLNSDPGSAERNQALFLSAALEMHAENWNAALVSLLGFLRATGKL